MITQGRWRDWPLGVAASVALTALVTVVLAPFESQLALLNEGLVFLVLTLGISTLWGVRVGIVAAVLTNLALNFFFIPPLHRFSVHDLENVVALAAFLIVSVIAGSLVSAARSSASSALRRQAESEALLRLTRELIGQTEPQAALDALCQQVASTLKAQGASVLSLVGGRWSVLAQAGDETTRRLPDTEERLIADRVAAYGQLEGLGYSGLGRQGRRPRIVLSPSPRVSPVRASSVTFIPLRMGDRPLGVLRLDGPFGDTPFRLEPERLLAAFAQEAALAIQRVELAQAAAHAEAWRQADEMKSALMASVSHDLKTPLAAIKTSVSSLLDTAVDWTEEDKLAFLATIESQADRLDRVISDILALNRIQSGVLTSDVRPTFVVDLLEEAREVAAAFIEGRTISLSSDDNRIVVMADRGLIRQALVNLLENAAKYSQPETPIYLETKTQKDEVQIIVADEGPGISAPDLPYVFDSFYRGAGVNGRTSGTGLGLAIVKAFTELSGGKVWVESSNIGSRFILALPRTTESVTAAV